MIPGRLQSLLQMPGSAPGDDTCGVDRPGGRRHSPSPTRSHRFCCTELPNTLRAPEPLQEDGETHHVLQFESVYTGELFTNTHGGIDTNHATQYEGLLNLLMTADLNRLGIPIPGKIGVLAQTTHGRGLSELFVGDTQIVSNIDSTDNIMQVSEYWFECNLIEDRVTLRLGKQDINNDFLVVDMASDFINSSFGISPSLNVPTYPAATAAVRSYRPCDRRSDVQVGCLGRLAQGGKLGLFGFRDYADGGRVPIQV